MSLLKQKWTWIRLVHFTIKRTKIRVTPNVTSPLAFGNIKRSPSSWATRWAEFIWSSLPNWRCRDKQKFTTCRGENARWSSEARVSSDEIPAARLQLYRRRKGPPSHDLKSFIVTLIEIRSVLFLCRKYIFGVAYVRSRRFIRKAWTFEILYRRFAFDRNPNGHLLTL